MNANQMMDIISEASDEYIQSALESRAQKKTSRPLRLVYRVALAAALIMSLAVTAYATDGQVIKSLVSGFWSRSYSSFQDLDKAMEEAGFEIDAKEAFENGYTFHHMKVETTHGLDGDRNRRLTYREIYISYENAEGHRLYFSANEDLEAIRGNGTPVAESRKIGDITLEYRESHYKFLPADREGKLTQEEQLWQQIPGNYISYGADEAHARNINHLSWTRDGISYSIMDMDATASSGTLFAMAEELIALP